MPKLDKKQKNKKTEPEIKWPVVEVRLFHADPRVMTEWSKETSEGNPLTGEMIEELMGWCTEAELKDRLFEALSEEEQKKVKGPENVKADNAEPLLSLDGEDIYCLNNLSNRPFTLQLAQDYSLEILRRKYRFNGEPFIIDKYGVVQSGQHRGAGLKLAISAWRKDAKLPKDQQQWQELWPEEPYIESMVVLGIEGDDETINTLDTGRRRTLEDVLYRSVYFEGKTASEKKALARVTNWAVKVVWDRTAQRDASYAPRRPHSESMDFISRHEKILKAVRFIYDEAGDNDKFSHFIPLGFAAGLMYLMASATSDVEKYQQSNSEEGLDFKLWDKAEKFWIDVAGNGKATEPLRELLLRIPETAGGSYNKDLRCGLCVKAWNLYSDGEKLTLENVEVETGLNDIQQPILAESPKLGGIDLDYSPPEKLEGEKKEKPASKKASPTEDVSFDVPNHGAVPIPEGECPQGGDHDYVTEDGESFCAKCFDPQTTVRTKPAPKKGKKK